MKDTFIHQYESQVAHAPLPLQLAETYSISSIIKDTTDKKVYLLKDQRNQPFILNAVLLCMLESFDKNMIF